MTKYGIKIRVANSDYRWILDNCCVDVGPILFETKEEGIAYAEKMQWKLYEVEKYTYKEF